MFDLDGWIGNENGCRKIHDKIVKFLIKLENRIRICMELKNCLNFIKSIITGDKIWILGFGPKTSPNIVMESENSSRKYWKMLKSRFDTKCPNFNAHS